MPLEELRASYDTLHQELEGKPSRYGRRPEPNPTSTTPSRNRIRSISRRISTGDRRLLRQPTRMPISYVASGGIAAE